MSGGRRAIHSAASADESNLLEFVGWGEWSVQTEMLEMDSTFVGEFYDWAFDSDFISFLSKASDTAEKFKAE